MSFLGEFSRISGSKRSLAVCTTVVQLGILRLRLFPMYFKFHPNLYAEALMNFNYCTFLGISNYERPKVCQV